MGISVKTHKMLWGRSGNICAFPECRQKRLIEDETETDDASLVGEEAHIVAREEDGPRGKSSLTPEERDYYNNLVLLCRIHHKMIDDQVNTYTVEKLHQMKNEHINWVNQSLKIDDRKQKDDEVYAGYIDELIKLAEVNEWLVWSSHVLSSGQPSINVGTYNKLRGLNKYILSRVWSNRYPQLEKAFMNFRVVLNDFLNVFDKYRVGEGKDEDDFYITEKFYHRLLEWDEKRYEKLTTDYNFHVDLIQDLMLELTRTANYLCDQIRKFIVPSFRIKEGVLLVESGPNMKFESSTIRTEFQSSDESEITTYPGLKKFMEIRGSRDYHFGEGINENYFQSFD